MTTDDTDYTDYTDLGYELDLEGIFKGFKLLDKYSRSQYRSFLAEFFPLESGDEYYLCFRPLDAIAGASDKACLYVRVETEELRSASKDKVLTESLVETLAAELPTLSRSV